MSEQKNIPELRFPEFNGDWERNALGELTTINPPTNNLPDKFIYIDLESVTDGELIKESEINKGYAPSRAQRYLEKNDILFQTVRPYQKNNYYFDKNGDYVASTGYAQIRTNQTARYIYQYLHLQKFVDEVIERCTGTSYPAINSKDLGSIKICLPSLLEQQKIASFFTAIDKKISQLRQKKTLLEQYKKGVMQKIFSQEIRFRDDDGKEYPEWEKKRLGEIGENIIGLTYSPKNVVDDGILVLRSSNIKNDVLDLGDQVKVNAAISAKLTIKRGDILICTRNGSQRLIGKNIIIDNVSTPMTFGAFMSVFRSEMNPFLVHLFKTDMYLKQIQQNLGARINQITTGQLNKFSFNFPCMEEQTKIAIFLSTIDVKISHTQTQIDKAKLWKKGLLQKMFV